TDAFRIGDQFAVLDFGNPLGLTSLPSGSGDCGDDPVTCLATPGISSAEFLLGPGNHSLTLFPILAPSGGGAGYLRIDAAPEPGTWLLLASAGVMFLVARVLRQRHEIRRFLVRHSRKMAVAFACAALSSGIWLERRPVVALAALHFPGPMSSQPIALTAD